MGACNRKRVRVKGGEGSRRELGIGVRFDCWLVKEFRLEKMRKKRRRRRRNEGG